MRFSSCCLLFAMLVGPAFRSARAQDKMTHAASATSKPGWRLEQLKTVPQDE